MMKTVFKTLFLLLLVLASFFAVRYFFLDSGYLLVAYNGYTLESSLWAAVLALVLIVVAVKIITACIRMIVNGSFLPLTARAKRRRAQRLSDRGLIQFANGHWKSAQKLLGQVGDSGSLPLLNYLVAARAASANNDMDACKEYLRKADKSAPAAYMAIGITQAEIQLSQKQFEQALATLNSLRKKSPKHPYLLKLLKQTYEQLADWQALAELLPTLRKRKVLDNDAFESLEKSIYNALFEQAWNKGRNLNNKQRTTPANDIWQSLNKTQRRNEDLMVSYARCLYRLKAEDEAETFIRRQLGSLYSTQLIGIYGQLKGEDSGRQLLAAEKLLAERPSDPELLLALGRMAARNKLVGKAKEYLETSLKLKLNVATYNELGQLLAELGEHERSSNYFQQGLAMAAEQA